MSLKLNKINRNFNIQVRLYFDSSSFNRETDSNPRYRLTPVKLNSIERVAFTNEGAKANGYTKISERFFGGIQEGEFENPLSDEETEAIFENITTIQ
mgnify:FL=1